MISNRIRLEEHEKEIYNKALVQHYLKWIGKEMNDNEVYIARLDMVIKPYWDENKFKYLDMVTWNAAIEAAALELAGDRLSQQIIRKLKK